MNEIVIVEKSHDHGSNLALQRRAISEVEQLNGFGHLVKQERKCLPGTASFSGAEK